MAYDATITLEQRIISGRRHLVILVEETDAANGSEATIAGIPFRVATIAALRSVRVSGTASTLQPRIWSGGRLLAEEASAAAAVRNVNRTPIVIEGGALVLEGRPNSGTDNAIRHEIVLVEGAA
jgi:hypothetical protein